MSRSSRVRPPFRFALHVLGLGVLLAPSLLALAAPVRAEPPARETQARFGLVRAARDAAWQGSRVPRVSETLGTPLEGRSAAAQELAAQARAALEQSRYAPAGRLARAALRFHSGNPTAIGVLEQIEGERRALLAERDVERAERAGDLSFAFEAARRVAEDQGTPERQARVARLRGRLLEQTEADAERAARGGDFDRAIELYQSASALSTTPGLYAETLQDLYFGRELQSAERAERACDYWEAAQHLADAQTYRDPQGFRDQVATILRGIQQRCPGF